MIPSPQDPRTQRTPSEPSQPDPSPSKAVPPQRPCHDKPPEPPPTGLAADAGGHDRPRAGVPGWREAEWEAFRERMRTERSEARARAATALTVFLVEGDGSGACEPLAGDDEALFELGVLAERWSRGLAGLVARAFGEFVAARRARPDLVGSGRALVGDLPVEEYLAEEVGAELRMPRSQAAGALHDATALVERLPATLAALEAGAVDGERAHTMAVLTDSLTDEEAGTVEQRVLARGGRSSRAAFRRAARRAVAAVDPDAVARRTRAAREDRRTWLQPHDDGTVDVGMTVPAELGLAVRQRVAALARRARGPQDTRSVEQVRADVMLALLLGVPTGDLAANEGRAVPVEVRVTVAASTLAGLDEMPGELSGYGGIPASVARELAEFGHWRKLLYDPVDGTLLGVGRSSVPDRQAAASCHDAGRRVPLPGLFAAGRVVRPRPHGRPRARWRHRGVQSRAAVPPAPPPEGRRFGLAAGADQPWALHLVQPGRAGLPRRTRTTLARRRAYAGRTGDGKGHGDGEGHGDGLSRGRSGRPPPWRTRPRSMASRWCRAAVLTARKPRSRAGGLDQNGPAGNRTVGAGGRRTYVATRVDDQPDCAGGPDCALPHP